MGRRSAGKRNQPTVNQRLDALYARVPDMADCKGLCYDSCTFIDMSPAERQRIADAGVVVPPLAEQTGRCPALTDLGRCSVYQVRPAICRLMGAAVDLTCEHGCRPTAWLTPAESRRILAEAFLIGGDAQRGRVEMRLAEDLEHNPIVQARHAHVFRKFIERAQGHEL